MATTDVSTLSTGVDVDEVAVKPTDEYAFWFNARPTQEGMVAKGLHLPVSNGQVDSLAEQLGWTVYTVIHQDGVEKPYWKVSPCSLIFLALNTQSATELRQTAVRKGIVQAWGPVIDKETGRFKVDEHGKEVVAHRVKVKVFILELARLGYYEPFLLATRGRITDSVLNTANAAYRLSRALSDYRRRTNDATPVYFYSVAVPVEPAAKPMKAGESTIYPLVAPLPARIDDAFIQQHETPPELVDYIRSSGMLPRVVAWATEESCLIREGRHPEQRSAVQVSEVGEQDVVEAEVHEASHAQPTTTALVSAMTPEEEEEIFAALCTESDGADSTLNTKEQEALRVLKEAFRQLYPTFSQSQGWWQTILARIFPQYWESAESVNEDDLTPDDLPVIRRTLESTRVSLQAKRAATANGKAARS